MQKQSIKGRLSFLAEWFQEEASILRSYIIYFYPLDVTIEVYDIRNKRTFLRRTKIPQLSVCDFHIGAKIDVFGRLFKIVDYFNEMTRTTLEKYRKRTFLLVKHSIIEHLGLIVSALINCNYNIDKAMMVQFTSEQAKAFLNKKTNVMKNAFSAELLAGPATGFEVIGDNALEKIKACREGSKASNPELISEVLVKLFNNDTLKAGIYTSDNEKEATQDLEFFFGGKGGLQPSLNLQNSTVAIIKPHCIKDGKLGDIISDINNHGFKLVGLRMQLMSRIKCEQLYEVYEGVLQEHSAMVAQLASGVCVALAVVCQNEELNSFKEFREFCGPFDPETAKLIRPNTLRAKYGKSKAINAIHCTDLPEDINAELLFMFNAD